MNPLPVSSKHLAKCTVQLSDAKLANCALLPLFDRRGITAKVLLLSHDTREYRLIDWQSGLVYVPLLAAVRMDIPWAGPQGASAGQPLWLYDPRGLVDRCRSSLRGFDAANCAGLLPREVVSVLWRRDLSRSSGVWLKKRGGLQFGMWKPGWLAAAPPQPTAEVLARPARGWVLDPIWMNRQPRSPIMSGKTLTSQSGL